MVDVADIRDESSLEAWLEDQPREVSVWIASRAAARVLPVWWKAVMTQDWARERDVTALKVLRSLVISVAAAKKPSANVKAAASLAVLFINPKSWQVSAADAARAAARAAVNTAFRSEFAREAAFAPEPAIFACDEAAIWRAVRGDATAITNSNLPDALPLWPEERGPVAEEWDAVKAQVAKEPDAADWQFWTQWYDALLDGRPMLGDAARTWEMLEQIALIDPATWDKGPEVVNPVIREIWQLYHLRDEVAALRAEKERLLAGRASPEARSHNQPPELVDAEPELARQVEIIWAGLDAAQDALEQEVPDKPRLREIAERMLAALKAIAAYCGKVGDRLVMSTATAGGPVLLDHVLNNGRLWQFVRDLLSFSGGG